MAYSLEQCWHRVPGGTATAAIELARAMPAVRPDVELIGVAGRHRGDPATAYKPPCPVHQLALRGAALYEVSLRLGIPRIERATGDVDLLHCTSIIPFASRAKLVATIHDLAFLKYPEFFSSRGNSVFRRSLKVLLKRAEILLCSSQATLNDCHEYGFELDRLRHVPLGVRTPALNTVAKSNEVCTRYGLPSEYLLFVGTLEPRKNLARLVAALGTLGDSAPELCVVGATGWGEIEISQTSQNSARSRVHFVGFVEPRDLGALYANATALCYPSLMEGFGLPILEAMSYGTPVVTSSGSSTQEVAGCAAVLVNPLDVASIAAGVSSALARRDELSQLGRMHAATMTWERTATRTAAIYDEVIG